MAWLDLRRYVLAYVLNRISVFTNLDTDQLEFSGTSFSVNNLEIDPQKLSAAAFQVRRARAIHTAVELSTQGIRVDVQGLQLEASVEALSADFGLSVVLEQTQKNMDEILDPQVPQQGVMAKKISQTALAQLRADISEIVLLLHIGDIDVQVDIARVSFELRKITVEGVNVTTTSRQHVPEFSPGSQSQHEEEIVEEPLAKSSASLGSLGSRKSLDSTSSDYYEAPATPEDVLIMHIANAVIQHDFPLTSLTVHVDTIRMNALSALSTIIACLNVFLNMQMNPSFEQKPGSSDLLDISVFVEEILMADCVLTSNGRFENTTSPILSLCCLSFEKDKFTLDSINYPGIDIVGPVAHVSLDTPISVTLPHPITIDVPLELLPAVSTFFNELALIFAGFHAPDADEPTAVEIHLPDIRLRIGDITILLFSQEFNMEKLLLNEIMITTGIDRVVITSPEFELAKNRINARRVSGQISDHMVNTLQEISAALSQSQPWEIRQPIIASTLDKSVPSMSSRSSTTKQRSTRLSIDSIVLSGFGATVSSTLIASYNSGTLRAKLKPELVYGDHRLTAAMQLVFDGNLLLYVDIFSATASLEKLLPSEGATTPDMPGPGNKSSLQQFKAPFPIDTFIKGSLELISPVAPPVGVFLDDIFHTSIKEDTINSHLPQARITLKDGTTQIPLAEMRDLNMRGNLSKYQFATTIKSINFSCCADSLYAVNNLIKFMQPTPKPRKFAVDGPEDLNVFDDVDESAFSINAAIHNQQHTALNYVESYYPNGPLARDGELVDLVDQLEIIPVPLNIQEDYLLELRSASPKPPARPIQLRFRLLVKAMSWDLYDGYDLQETRKALSAAVDRVSSISNKLNDMNFENDESPIIGDLMFNSIYIGARPSEDQDLRRDIDRELGSSALCRSEAAKISARSSKTKIELKAFESESIGDIISSLTIQVEEFMIRDLVPTSKWKALLSYDSAVQGERKGFMATIGVDAINSGHESELRVKASICPLRVQIDQDTLEFVTRFFEFQPDTSENALDERDEVDEPVLALAAELALRPFFQRFELYDVHICLDYKPKKVDYAGLRSGHAAEFMNLFVVERSTVVLRHLVLHGISGYHQLGKALGDVWTPDVRNNQLVAVLSGLGPLKSIFQVAGGIKKFFVVPVREYRRESGVASGIRRGSTVLAKNTANELVRLGVRVINGPRTKRDPNDESALFD